MDNIHILTNIFKALSDKTRLKILKLLECGEMCICDIVFKLGVSQPRISFHLKILKKAGLIKMHKEGTRILCSLDDSDLFKRFLILSILEKIDSSELEQIIHIKKGGGCYVSRNQNFRRSV